MCILCIMSANAGKYGMYMFFSPIENSEVVYEDENVKATICQIDTKMAFVIFNKTSNIVYVDKANSFQYTNGEPKVLFNNEAYSSGNSSSSGASVNLGAVAGAFGLGGGIGSALRGVSVGGGSGTTSTTTIYEQRVLAIAPQSAVTLCEWGKSGMNQNIVKCSNPSKCARFIDEYGNKTKSHKGLAVHYSAQRTPLIMRGVFNYSLSEKFDETHQVSVGMYVSDIIIDDKKAVSNPNIILSSFDAYKDKICYRVADRTYMTIGALMGLTFGSIVGGTGLICGIVFAAIG